MNKNIVGWKAIELSEVATAALAALRKGQVLALRMKHTNSSIDELPKVQIEFAEKIEVPGRVKTAASMFNTKDVRFSQGAQRVWEGADVEVAESFGFGSIPEGEASMEILKIVDPVITKDKDGEIVDIQDFRIQVTEDVESNLTEEEAKYKENYLKRKGKDGQYFYTPSGERVITRRRLITVDSGTNPVHTFLEGKFQDDPNEAPEETNELVSKNVHADIQAGG